MNGLELLENIKHLEGINYVFLLCPYLTFSCQFRHKKLVYFCYIKILIQLTDYYQTNIIKPIKFKIYEKNCMLIRDWSFTH